MSAGSKIILFGDLTYDAIAGLKALVAIKENPLLTTFFERTTFMLREEIGFLPYAERRNFVQFINLPELLAKARCAPCLHPALEKALACAHQLGRFIKYIPYARHDNGDLLVLAITLQSASHIHHCGNPAWLAFALGY